MTTVSYQGTVDNGGWDVEVITADGQRKPLRPRTDLRNHSPTGFSWGYSGSGPAQLALGMLAFHLERFPDDRALAVEIAGFPEQDRGVGGIDLRRRLLEHARQPRAEALRSLVTVVGALMWNDVTREEQDSLTQILGELTAAQLFEALARGEGGGT